MNGGGGLTSETNKAYTAGIIDGEGSISLVVNTSRKTCSGRPATAPKLVLQVSSTCKDLIEWLVETWEAGSVVTIYRPRRPHHLTAYGWRVRSTTAASILQEVLPYMKIKVPQAQLGIRVAAMSVPCRRLGDQEMARRMAFRDEMLRLNGTIARATVPSAVASHPLTVVTG
jgi:hypothetical protein